MWHNVFERGGLQPGETLLVHGGSSGIGTTAIQLANAFGARVIATAGSRRSARPASSSAPTRAINYKTEDFVAAVKEATGGKGVDVILDMVGGDYIERNYERRRDRRPHRADRLPRRRQGRRSTSAA